MAYINHIETLRAIVQSKLHERNYKNLEEMKKELVKVWNTIPVDLCRRLVELFDFKIKAIMKSGSKFNRNKYKQI